MSTYDFITINEDVFPKNNSWWTNINTGGLFFSQLILDEIYPNGPDPVDKEEFDNLLELYKRFQIADIGEIREELRQEWIYELLDKLKHPKFGLKKVNTRNLKKLSKSSHSLISKEDNNGFLLIKDSSKDKFKPDDCRIYIHVLNTDKKLGIGKNRAIQANFTTGLIDSEIKLGLLTNGRQFRLIYATLNHQAFIEWSADEWFDTEQGYYLFSSFIMVLSERLKDKKKVFDIHTQVNNSRDKQGELSDQLGIQIREAVEIFLEGHSGTLETSQNLLKLIFGKVPKDDEIQPKLLEPIYQAAIRIHLRIIIILYAESRNLFPLGMPNYRDSYSMEQLYLSLEKSSTEYGDARLDEEFNAWQRILGLFSLIYYGSPFNEFEMIPYGGSLFKPGDLDSQDPILKVLSVFEGDEWRISDWEILKILRKLKLTTVKTKIGRRTVIVSAPVDFSSLRTEYIGIIYEGLLDYQLRYVRETDQNMLLLDLGKEELLLPMSTLRNLSDKQLKIIVGGVKKGVKSGKVISEESLEEDDDWKSARTLVLKMVDKGKLVSKPEDRVRKSMEILLHVYPPGKLLIARWNGSRKGSGTYYTKPRLVIPTVRRTLEPLFFIDGDLKTPEEILELNIIDPAMGSGSFLVAALQYTSEMLVKSLEKHKRTKKNKTTIAINIFNDKEEPDDVYEDIADDEFSTNILVNRMKRFVAEYCIYGVDINPLAVELAKLAIWIETLNRDVQFKFLDHRLKIGNSLVGAYLHEIFYYPLEAFSRKTGDEKHDRAVVHYEHNVDKNIMSTMKGEVKRTIAAQFKKVHSLVDLDEFEQGILIGSIHQQYLKFQNLITEFGVISKQSFDDKKSERKYIELINSSEFRRLKVIFDYWCAFWFLPVSDLNKFVFDENNIYHPANYHKIILEKPNLKKISTINKISTRIKFFHWQLEFPNIFFKENPGFDTVIGNPPWEISKPNSLEFFSNYNPVYNTYGKQEGIKQQKLLFVQNENIEKEWLDYRDYFKAMSNFVKFRNNPFGNMKDKRMIKFDENSMFSNIPFKYQGSADLNTYKMFSELFFFLTKINGRTGIIVPSGIYSDSGTKNLRELFLNKSNWDWLFSFTNRNKIFKIDSRFKFAILLLEKGGETDTVNTAFMRTNLDDWENSSVNEDYVMQTTFDDIKKFSPDSLAFMELNSKMDLHIVNKIFENGTPIGKNEEGEWKVKYKREFDIVNDSKLFISKWDLDFEAMSDCEEYRLFGILKDKETGEYYFPVYQGRNMDIGNFAAQNYIEGAGKKAKFERTLYDRKKADAQFYMKREVAFKRLENKSITKNVIRDISNTTNTRTMINTIIPNFPCIHKVPIYTPINGNGIEIFSVFLNSFVLDFYLRNKMVGTSLTLHILNDLILPNKNHSLEFFNNHPVVKIYVANYFYNGPYFVQYWIQYFRNEIYGNKWAITRHERLRLSIILNAISAFLFELTFDEYSYILKENPNDLKGFWRINKSIQFDKLGLYKMCYAELLKTGILKFLENDWQLPQDIQEILGKRYLDWQEKLDYDESWETAKFYRDLLSEIYES